MFFGPTMEAKIKIIGARISNNSKIVAYEGYNTKIILSSGGQE